MDKVIGAGRQHRMQHEANSSRIEIEEPFGRGRWMVNLEAARTDETVEVRILGRLVVVFTPQEAREFAQALDRIAGA
ncbi:hypothetical protein [Bosea sp. FBZP-16]|uniref:hypothetical protein n=1 Tax=Bosea sp. FBZP-16 TaxID=2065382 RepID=UPI000C315BF1|nr:hypothetical protein [Bosea sp. FBZP-16]